jgi:hypothetical protein
MGSQAGIGRTSLGEKSVYIVRVFVSSGHVLVIIVWPKRYAAIIVRIVIVTFIIIQSIMTILGLYTRSQSLCP